MSVTANEAVSVPAAVGLNSTETVQLAPAASEAPQVVADFTNDVAFVPVMVSDVSDNVAVPEFLIVTACAAVVAPTAVEAKVSDVGDRVTAAVLVAVPLTATVCVPAPSITFSFAVKEPATAGLNDIVTVQLAPAASVAPTGQVVVSENELALVPLKLTLAKLTAAFPHS